MDEKTIPKFCPIIQADCKDEQCQWFIRREKALDPKGGGRCAIESLALDMLAFRAKGF